LLHHALPLTFNNTKTSPERVDLQGGEDLEAATHQMGEPNGVVSARSSDSEINEDAVAPVDGEEEDGDGDDDDDDDESEKDDEEESPERSQNSAPQPRPPQQLSPAHPYPYYGYPPPPAAGYHAPPGYAPLAAMSNSFPYPHPSNSTYVDNAHAEDPKPDHRRNRGGVSKPFPEVLHEMLADLERQGKADIASFFSHGRAFAIHKPRVFITEVMPQYFRQTKLTSFQRQLNLYGFRRISSGIDNGGYWVSWLVGLVPIPQSRKYVCVT
jgi:hypothetical protein